MQRFIALSFVKNANGIKNARVHRKKEWKISFFKMNACVLSNEREAEKVTEIRLRFACVVRYLGPVCPAT